MYLELSANVLFEVNIIDVRGELLPLLTVDSTAPLKNCTDKVSMLFRLFMSSTPIGMVVIEARVTKEVGVDFPTRKCPTAAPHRLNAARSDVVFPANAYNYNFI